ncbi:MAG: phosphotransferase [Lachnospiraceae bacterium]|nr:phosphotransferase [Lachnospiraceae bacterium]
MRLENFIMKYIIVQAGGKGTRLGYLTKNKPKAMTSIENLPMIFHLFRKYPDKRFIIIADYKDEVLSEYLKAFADVKYLIIKAQGKGTCSGIKQSLELIPNEEPFMLIWSDLILQDNFKMPNEYSNDLNVKNSYACMNDDEKIIGDYIGLSKTFPCRWKYENGQFSEECSTEYGVAGFFLFHDKSVLVNVPESGEFVRWMKEKEMIFNTISLAGTREFGLLEEYEKLETVKTRPFNRITIDGDILIKEPVDEQGSLLAKRECNWYDKARQLNIIGIPKIFDTSPIRMEYIKGRNIYECTFDKDTKYRILQSLIKTMKDIHMASSVTSDAFSMKEAYFNKTMKRLSKIEYLVPFAREKSIVINGRECRNVFFYRNELERKLDQLKTDKFCFIHGDCTFSNLMIRDNGEPVLIDPRGYFGYTELYGDERYDWAKLYYSIVGNYDNFNLKKFSLDIGKHSMVDGEIIKDLKYGEVRISIESNGWEDMEEAFFKLTGANAYEIKLLHSIIWLSLTTYAWQDYDSVCGAFYNGLYYLEEVL